MTCCPEPSVRHGSGHTSARCASCGFTWTFECQGKGKFKSKKPKWGPKWFTIDSYDRAWRFKDYDRHEVVGTRRRGKREDYVIGCPKYGVMLSVPTDDPPDDLYCPHCDRSGPFGPMVRRFQERVTE